MNSFVTIQEADEYISTKYHDGGWSNLQESDKQKIVFEATRHIENVPFIELPEEITETMKNATCEECVAIVSVDNVHTENQRLNIKSIGFGEDRVSYGEAQPKALLSFEAQLMLNQYIQGSFRIV